jgi:3-(methylthio)propionyl---CoA ligase
MLEPGLIMDRQLLISAVIEHAAAQNGDIEIVSRETHGPVFRYNYRDCAARARKLANAFGHMQMPDGCVVGTLAWNNYRHLEIYFGVSGSGRVIHTCNPRLHLDQLAYIINHAGDRLFFFDATFAPLVAQLAELCPRVEAWICMADRDNMPAPSSPALSSLTDLVCYEELIAPQSGDYAWPEFDERAGAALCYTSGTTGNPKGALYSHRSIVLNSMMICTPAVLGLSPRDAVLPVVPMFHINAWCIPYGAAIGGAKMVLPGPRLDGAGLYELMEAEHVTISAGVPTVWLGLLQHMEQHGLRFSRLQRVISGGSAVPSALIAKFDEIYGVEVRQGWGMTETVGGATMGCLDREQQQLSAAARHAVIARGGKSIFGCEIKVVNERGETLPRDGESQGELMVRGAWIISGYFRNAASPLVDGWFPTGDIATIDARGVMQIRDRVKDLIKTGGEWISSIDLENTAVGHPSVAAAAVIGVKHPKWQERPLLFVVRKPGHSLEPQDILEFLAARVTRWWVPDEVIFLDSLPVGGTGKVQKAALREKYGNIFDQR